MQITLERDFGVEVRWTESESTSTWTNARLSAAKLRAAGIRRFYLVTHAWHMPRAMLAFAGTGLEAVPAPTCFVSRSALVRPEPRRAGTGGARRGQPRCA